MTQRHAQIDQLLSEQVMLIWGDLDRILEDGRVDDEEVPRLALIRGGLKECSHGFEEVATELMGIGQDLRLGRRNRYYWERREQVERRKRESLLVAQEAA